MRLSLRTAMDGQRCVDACRAGPGSESMRCGVDVVRGNGGRMHQRHPPRARLPRDPSGPPLGAIVPLSLLAWLVGRLHASQQRCIHDEKAPVFGELPEDQGPFG